MIASGRSLAGQSSARALREKPAEIRLQPRLAGPTKQANLPTRSSRISEKPRGYLRASRAAMAHSFSS
jgi:hypothetical protein